MTDKNPFAAFFQGNDFSQIFDSFQGPGFDMKAFMETQRKNMQAMTEAQSLAIENFRSIAEKQADMFKEMMADNSVITKSLVSTTGPEDKAAEQARIFKAAYERSLENMREISGLMTRAGAEASDLFSRRMAASMKEMRGAIEKPGRKKSAA